MISDNLKKLAEDLKEKFGSRGVSDFVNDPKNATKQMSYANLSGKNKKMFKLEEPKKKLGKVDGDFYTKVSEGNKAGLRKGDSIADVSAKLFNFLKKTEQERKLHYELMKDFQKENEDEDLMRHKELVKALKERKPVEKVEKEKPKDEMKAEEKAQPQKAKQVKEPEKKAEAIKPKEPEAKPSNVKEELKKDTEKEVDKVVKDQSKKQAGDKTKQKAEERAEQQLKDKATKKAEQTAKKEEVIETKTTAKPVEPIKPASPEPAPTAVAPKPPVSAPATSAASTAAKVGVGTAIVGLTAQQAIASEFSTYNISAKGQANILAQVEAETGFNSQSENLNYGTEALSTLFKKYFPSKQLAEQYSRKPEKIANRIYANRMGNGPEESGDGWKYRGRGFIQITGKDAYKSLSKDIGIDLVSNPDLLNDPKISIKSLPWFFLKYKRLKPADLEDISKVNAAIGFKEKIKTTGQKESEYRAQLASTYNTTGTKLAESSTTNKDIKTAQSTTVIIDNSKTIAGGGGTRVPQQVVTLSHSQDLPLYQQPL